MDVPRLALATITGPLAVLFATPYVCVGAALYLSLRAVGRSRSPNVYLLAFALLCAAVVSIGFTLWVQSTAVHDAPIGGILRCLILPVYSLGVALFSFVLTFALLYLMRFISERAVCRKNSATTAGAATVSVITVVLSIVFLRAVINEQMIIYSAASGSSNVVLRHIEAQALAENDYRLLGMLARNHAMSSTDLRRLFDACKDTVGDFNPREHSVFQGLAENPNTPPDILDILSRSRQVSTRIAVVINPSSSESTIDRLAKDNDHRVRSWLTGRAAKSSNIAEDPNR
jgi:hypothetical protein